MLRWGQGGVGLAILPEEFVEDDVVGGVGVAEVEVFSFFPRFGVHFIEQAVIAIAVIGGEGWLRGWTAEQRSHNGGAGIVGVHGRNAEKGFESADHVDGGVEGVFDEGMRLRERGIFADDQRDAAMGVDVVGTVLRVVFENENGGIVPVRAVGDGVDDAANGKVVVGNGGCGTRLALSAAGGVIVGKAQENELRETVFAGIASS